VTWNPIRSAIDRALDVNIRQNALPGIQFSEPLGDPGWFGPGSTVWHVHGHFPSAILASAASAVMETLHPGTAWAGPHHSMSFERLNGVPTGAMRPENYTKRAAQSTSVFLATAFASSPVAEHAAQMVNNMHRKVHGQRPDGISYDTQEPDFYRWNYATVVWGFARSHELYHPRPLQGADLDDYFASYTKVGQAIYGSAIDLPATKAEVDDLLESTVSVLGVSPPGAKLLGLYRPHNYPLVMRPVVNEFFWVLCDMMPDWARDLIGAPASYGQATTKTRRAIMSGLMAVLNTSGRHLPEIAESYRRAAAQPVDELAVSKMG
jgi:uncharacterized protein (DUF2236 family)